jgi:hypothetical protein
MPQLLPSHSWKSIFPAVVSAVKLGAAMSLHQHVLGATDTTRSIVVPTEPRRRRGCSPRGVARPRHEAGEEELAVTEVRGTRGDGRWVRMEARNVVFKARGAARAM